MRGIPQQNKASVTPDSLPKKAAATYWSKPSAAEATATPEEATSSLFYGEHSYPSRGERVKETTLDENENMDAFLKKLFEEDGIPLHEDLKTPAAPAPQVPLSEDEKAEMQRLKDIETKEKRAELNERHTRWERKLTRVGEEELLKLMEQVKVMRKTVIESMRTSPEMFNLLKSMQEDGFKQVENTDRFLQKMKKEDKKEEEVSSKWTKIVAKVRERLDGRTIETTTYLQKWYLGVMQKEKIVVSNHHVALVTAMLTIVINLVRGFCGHDRQACRRCTS